MSNFTTPQAKFPVSTDVPVPKKPSGAPRKYPFPELEIGHSFFAPNKTPQTLSHSLCYWGKKLSCKFTSRTRTENGVRGVRVWRIK